MLPNKSHLQLIVVQLEKSNSELDKSYNFAEFFDRCRAIFTPKQQTELSEKLESFKEKNIIGYLEAQSILYRSRIMGIGGFKVLRVYQEDGLIEKIPLNLTRLELGLRSIVVWCRKQVIKLVSEQDINFEKIENIDLEVKE